MVFAKDWRWRGIFNWCLVFGRSPRPLDKSSYLQALDILETRDPSELFGRLLHQNCMAWVTILKHVTPWPFFFEDDRDNAMTKGRYILVLEQFSCSVSTLMRKDGGSSWIVLFFTLLMLPWHGFVKCLGGVLLSVKTSWNGRQTHLTWIPPDFFL